jgi:hypothetical protein
LPDLVSQSSPLEAAYNHGKIAVGRMIRGSASMLIKRRRRWARHLQIRKSTVVSNLGKHVGAAITLLVNAFGRLRHSRPPFPSLDGYLIIKTAL